MIHYDTLRYITIRYDMLRYVTILPLLHTRRYFLKSKLSQFSSAAFFSPPLSHLGDAGGSRTQTGEISIQIFLSVLFPPLNIEWVTAKQLSKCPLSDISVEIQFSLHRPCSLSI